MTHTADDEAGSSGAFDAESFTAALVHARRTGQQIATDAVGVPPPDLAAAFAVQGSVARTLGAATAGWKVSSAPDGALSAPIFADLVSGDGETSPVSAGRVIGLEVEIALRLRPDFIEAGRPNPAPVTEAIEAVSIGIELIGSRFADHAAVPFTAHLADCLANAGYVVGAAVDPAIVAAIGRAACRVEIDGRVVHDEVTKHPDGDPLSGLVAGAASAETAAGPWTAEHFFTTGTLCGVVPVSGPCRITASIGDFGSVTTILAA